MSETEDKKEKFDVIKHKVDSLVMAIRDMDDQEVDELSMKELHDVDKHIFEILKIIERY